MRLVPLLTLVACAHPPPPADLLPVALAGVDYLQTRAGSEQLAAADREDVTGCVAWALVGAAAGEAHALIPAAALGPVAEIPELEVDLTPCAGVPVDQVVDVSAQVALGLRSVADLLPLWQAPDQCRAEHVTAAVVQWAEDAAAAVPPQADGWTIDVPARPVDLSTCP